MLLSLAIAACATASPTGPTTSAPTSPSPLDAPDRSAEDRRLDAQRRPAELLAFFRIAPGQRVADLFAGGGYTSEAIARTVGPSGRVYSQNNRFVIDRFANAPWTARLATPAMANVTRVEREFDAPIPPEVTGLDAVVFVLAYHDTVWQGVDRAAMNRNIFESLRSGGVYGIVDHSAPPGSGVRVAQTLHRIEEQTLIDEVLAAGFRLDARADLLRNADDARDWNASPRAAGARRGQSDRFVLRFVKP